MTMPGFIAVLIHDFIRPVKDKRRTDIEFGEHICATFNANNEFKLKHHNPKDDTIWECSTAYSHLMNPFKNRKMSFVTMKEVNTEYRVECMVLYLTHPHHQFPFRICLLRDDKHELAKSKRKTTCGCGSVIKITCLESHRKTKKHLTWLNT